MHIHLSKADGVPVYLQIVNQVKYLVASGRLAPGDELPTIRALADQLVINPNTVAKAYRQLEVEGVVCARRSAGTFVSDAGSPLARERCLELLAARIDALLADARGMSVSTREVLALVRERARILDQLPPQE